MQTPRLEGLKNRIAGLTPVRPFGRVASVDTICVFGGLVLGSALGAVLAQQYGVTAPFWFGFAGSAVFVVLIWRQMSHVAHADEATEASPVMP